ncbi:cation diffusion facilitator family transporter [Puia sp. P3]|uniref:cation diffusion facilitator family transporter n=1 Tax=Puia sp. P3 TaxID=3423952 RepID=UPI003D678B20
MQSTDIHPSVKGMRTTAIGIAISIVLVFAKFISGYIGHSYALIADASETSADVLSSLLLWIGLRISMKPADKEHPYGHGKAEPLAAIVISLFLLATACWIAWHAIEYIRTPHQLPRRFTLAILLIVILIKEGMFRYVLKVGREINSQAVKADARHHRSDVITSVAAFVGILVAILMGRGYESADDWAALVASGIIVYNAIHLLRPALDEVMDAAPSGEIVRRVRRAAADIPGVDLVEKCYVRKMGFDYYVDLHVQVNPGLSVAKGHEIAHHVKDSLLRSIPGIKDALIHVEPYTTK